MKEERLWELVSLKHSGEATPEELQELQNLLNENPDMGFKIDVISQVWSNHSSEEVETETAFNKHLQRLSNHFTSPAFKYEDVGQIDQQIVKRESKFKRVAFWTSAIAASIIVAFLMIQLVNYPKKLLKPSENIVTTKPGSKSKLILPDGTQVWLNGDSKITYDKNFGNEVREVSLTGEAFFDVIKDANRPFIIHSKTIDIKVLGTAFNVRSYPDERTTETSLIRGIVEVTLKNNPGKKIILKPNEKLVVKDDLKNAKMQKDEAEVSDVPMLTLTNIKFSKGDSSAIETSWIKNKLAFDEESFDAVAKKIEKWYGVTIAIKDDKIRNEKFSGVFEDETLSEVMDALRLTANFEYSVNKKHITIEP